jgi:hypothetical protein
MKALYLIAFLLFACVGIAIGFFFMLKPQLAIEIQKRFYAKINWRMEPISMSKEIRNTRIMGGLIVVILVAMLVYLLTQTPTPP